MTVVGAGPKCYLARDGGKQTMTDDQIRAACQGVKALGKRSGVHAQGADGGTGRLHNHLARKRPDR